MNIVTHKLQNYMLQKFEETRGRGEAVGIFSTEKVLMTQTCPKLSDSISYVMIILYKYFSLPRPLWHDLNIMKTF